MADRNYEPWIEWLGRHGYERFHQEDFAGSHGTESCEVWADIKRGLLLFFDTFTREREARSLNGGRVYYNWRPEPDYPWDCASSGCFNGIDSEGRRVWVGYHDCREALGFNMRRLEQHGELIVPWVKTPRLWLHNYAETKTLGDWGTESYREKERKSHERIPQRLRDALNIRFE